MNLPERGGSGETSLEDVHSISQQVESTSEMVSERCRTRSEAGKEA